MGYLDSPKVLCVGEALLDQIADQVGCDLEQALSWTSYAGGAPANVACALVRLGTAAGFIGCLGQDAIGNKIADCLEEQGVEISGLQRHPTALTRQVYVTRTLAGDRQFAGFGAGFGQVALDAYADAQLTLKDWSENLWAGARFWVTGTLGLAYPRSRTALLRGSTWARSQGMQCFVDLNWRPMFWLDPDRAVAEIAPLLAIADFVKLSLEEADWCFQTSDPSQIAQELPQVKGVFVTDGDRGCHYWVLGESGFVPAFAVAAVDTTGAGDAFVAGILHQLCCYPLPVTEEHRVDWPQVLRYASAVGALTTLKVGTIAAQPTAQVVDAFLAGQC